MLTEQIASLPISAAKQSVQTMDNCSLQRTLHNLNESRVISNSFCQASLVILGGLCTCSESICACIINCTITTLNKMFQQQKM